MVGQSPTPIDNRKLDSAVPIVNQTSAHTISAPKYTPGSEEPCFETGSPMRTMWMRRRMTRSRRNPSSNARRICTEFIIGLEQGVRVSGRGGGGQWAKLSSYTWTCMVQSEAKQSVMDDGGHHLYCSIKISHRRCSGRYCSADVTSSPTPNLHRAMV